MEAVYLAAKGCLQSREEWVLSLPHNAVTFMLPSQAIMLVLGRPLESTEIIYEQSQPFLVSVLSRLFLTIAADASRSGR